MRKLLIISMLTLFLIGGIAFGIIFINRKSTLNQDNERLNEAVLRAVTLNKPSLINNGMPVIDVTSVSKIEDKWYVAVIKSAKEKDVVVPVKVVLVEYNQSNLNLSVILGPDDHFTENQLIQANLPDAVILELEKI